MMRSFDRRSPHQDRSRDDSKRVFERLDRDRNSSGSDLRQLLLTHPKADAARPPSPVANEISSDDELVVEPIKPGEALMADLALPPLRVMERKSPDDRYFDEFRGGEDYRQEISQLSPELVRRQEFASRLGPRVVADDYDDADRNRRDDDDDILFESLRRDINKWEQQRGYNRDPHRHDEISSPERFFSKRISPAYDFAPRDSRNFSRSPSPRHYAEDFAPIPVRRSFSPLECNPRGGRDARRESRDRTTSRRSPGISRRLGRTRSSSDRPVQSRGSSRDRKNRRRTSRSPSHKRRRRNETPPRRRRTPRSRSPKRSPVRQKFSPSNLRSSSSRGKSPGERWSLINSGVLLPDSPQRVPRPPQRSRSQERIRKSLPVQEQSLPQPSRVPPSDGESKRLYVMVSKRLSPPTSVPKPSLSKSSGKKSKITKASGAVAKAVALAEQRSLIDSLLCSSSTATLEKDPNSHFDVVSEKNKSTNSDEYVASSSEMDEPREKSVENSEIGDLRSLLKARQSKTSPQKEETNSCICCSSTSHLLKNCPEFLSLKPRDRYRIVKASGTICYKCLNAGHSAMNCKIDVTCLHENCTKDGHHTLLHFEPKVGNVQDLLSQIRQKQAPVNKHMICVECQGPHHVVNCPDNFCRKCENKGHRARECPKYPGAICFICKASDHVEKDCPQKTQDPRYCRKCEKFGHYTRLCQAYPSSICLLCKSEDHEENQCPERLCSYCQKKGHVKEDCLLLFSKKTGEKYCKKCETLGHIGPECKQYPNRICYYCKSEEHETISCPSITCTLCKTVGHISTACPQNENMPVCRRCDQKGHYETSCPTYPRRVCYNCKSEGHAVRDCPTSPCTYCHEFGHSIKQCKAKSRNIRCLKCSILGHKIENCPFVECNNCGGSGHMSKECTYRRNEFRQKKKPEQEKFKNVISIDYHHIASSGPKNPIEAPTKTMMTFFQERLKAQGRNPDLAGQMMLYWQLSKHNEQSLWNMFYKNSPCSRDTFRLLLLSELANAPSASCPMNVHTSELLDETIEFFMPSSQSQTFPTPSSSMVTPLKQNIDASDAFDSRLKSLEPLREFIVRKMKSLSQMFGIQESYIVEVSTSIQKLIAEIGLSLHSLRRHFMTDGKDTISRIIQEKITGAKTKLPERVSGAYVASMVTDFATDFFK